MDLFSRIAHRYDSIIRGFAIETIKYKIKLDSEKILLDLGGGTGRVALELSKLVNGYIIVDRSFEMLQQAYKKTRSLFLVQGVGENLPFRKGSIPQIFTNDTLHHIHRQDETLSNCYDSLEKGGRLTIREYDPEAWRTKFLILFEWVLMFGSKFHSPRKLAEMCKKYGFETKWEFLTKTTYLLEAKK